METLFATPVLDLSKGSSRVPIGGSVMLKGHTVERIWEFSARTFDILLPLCFALFCCPLPRLPDRPLDS
jgi:hypothetical protein